MGSWRAAVLLVLAIAGQPLHAAPEYLRLVGTVRDDYGPVYDPNTGDQWNLYYMPTAGFYPGQPLYFDFLIDTAANATGHPDTYQDFFAAEYLAGTVPVGFPAYGLTTSFAEGTLTWLVPGDRLLVGRVYSAIQFNDRSIDTWQVGETLALMGNGYTTRNSIGSLTLVYRDSAPPPLLTPLPPTITLLAAGLATLAARRRPTASRPSPPAH